MKLPLRTGSGINYFDAHSLEFEETGNPRNIAGRFKLDHL